MKKLHLDPSKPPVFDGISLRIAQGETCGLCGPGASGKSLLLKIICGLIRPEAGTVAVAGQDLGAASPSELRSIQSQIGYLFQNNALFDSMTVQENVAFPLRQRVRLGQGFVGGAAAVEKTSQFGHGQHVVEPAPVLAGGHGEEVVTRLQPVQHFQRAGGAFLREEPHGEQGRDKEEDEPEFLVAQHDAGQIGRAHV